MRTLIRVNLGIFTWNAEQKHVPIRKPVWSACCWQPSCVHEGSQPEGGANAVFGRAE